ncbi:ribosome biogenesis factor YjgA [Porticoccaceae bacterium LTM1]|nr:ribosome biogenesis factor YjgA [Porticoccaceae bacterium LTM1]
MIDFPEDYGKDPDEPEEVILVSKSEMKRDMLALQKLGEDLVDLPEKQLEKFDLPDVLLEGIMLARRLKNREGRRRQLQYIGKVMRDIDVTEIRQQMENLQLQSRGFRQHFHQLEEWRDRLIEEGDDAVTALLEEQPDADRQKLRQLIRQAQKEQSQQKPPAASRKIFKYLRELFE